MACYIDSNIGSDPGMLENLFQQIIIDLKMSFPIWDDFMTKATKLHTVLRSAVGAIGTFLDSMQKVADMALGTRGATSDLGSALTRLCLRQKGLEDKMKVFVSSIMECLVNPLQDRMDEWKKMVTLLDKDHAKESKRVHQEMKKAFAETIALKKKAKKGKPGAGIQLEQAVAGYKEKYEMLEALERNSVKMALIEERSRFCHFVNCLNPVMDCQLAMLSEISHISEIINYLRIQALQPCFGPNQCCSVQEWRKVNSPERMDLSSPGSPSASLGSSKSNQSGGSSGDGRCTSSTPLPLPHPPAQQQLYHSSGRKVSDDSSNGNGDEDQFNSGPNWSEKTSSKMFPIALKSNSNVVGQRADHCAKCCQHCQSQSQQQSPQMKKVPSYDYAIPRNTQVHLVNEVSSEKVSNETRQTDKANGGGGDAPLTGYVNMNQLATLAVQQNDFSRKEDKVKNDADNKDNNNKDKNCGNDKDNKTDDKKTQKPEEIENVTKISKGSRQFQEGVDVGHNRSRTTEDINLKRASLTPDLENNKSNKSRDLSLPPTFRKPFRAGGALNFTASPRLFHAINRGRSERQGQEPKQMKDQIVRMPSSESPPPPPLPEDYQTCTELVLESDYLPLPPPPVAPQEKGCLSWNRQLQFSTIPEVSSLSNETPVTDNLHLGSMLKAGKASQGPGTILKQGGEHGRLTETDSVNTFADSIRRGVSLRSALTNDRSAPRFPSN